MPDKNGPSQSHATAQLAVTMATAAYLEVHASPQAQRAAIDASLASPALPTAGEWSVAWGPVTVGENLAFIARGPVLGPGPARRYAYSIRGTVIEPWNLIEDLLDAIGLHDLPWGGGGEAQISDGMREGWKELTTACDDGRSMLDFLRQIEPGSEVVVTGHSLGAMLATVMAVYLRSELDSNLRIRSCTFAAPTAGNRAFAELYAAHFGGAGRYYNCLDVVPKAFAHSDLESIKSLYPCVDGVKCGDCYACRSLVDLAQEIAGHRYVHAAGGTRLQAKAYAESGSSLRHFLQESLAQHHAVHYMWLLGLPLEAVRVFDPDWSPPDIPCPCPDDPDAAAASATT